MVVGWVKPDEGVTHAVRIDAAYWFDAERASIAGSGSMGCAVIAAAIIGLHPSYDSTDAASSTRFELCRYSWTTSECSR